MFLAAPKGGGESVKAVHTVFYEGIASCIGIFVILFVEHVLADIFKGYANDSEEHGEDDKSVHHDEGEK